MSRCMRRPRSSRSRADDEGVSGVRWRNRKNGIEETKPIRRVFLFVGADPNTDWLANCGVKMNEKGFVCTGSDSQAPNKQQT